MRPGEVRLDDGDTRMRHQVIELAKLGPLPSSDVAVRESLDQLVDNYARLIGAVEKPISDDEARVLVRILGPDDCFGLMWALIQLIETAPGWPLADCIETVHSEGVRLLKVRAENASHARNME